MMLDPVIAWSLRLALALLFVAAARHKLSDCHRFEATVRAYALLPSAAAQLLASFLPWVEVGIAIGLVLPFFHRVAAVAAAALLSIYTLAISANIARGQREIDCGCFASSAKVPLSLGLVGRNLVLIVCACLLVLPVGTRPFVWIDGITLGMTLVTLSLLWAAGQRLARVGPALRGLGGTR